MANQEYPIFALHRGANLLGDVMMPQFTRAAPAARKPSGPSLFERLDTWFWHQRQRANEAYLARSHDVFEVERRMRDLERSSDSRFY
jgi:hypothetical protein